MKHQISHHQKAPKSDVFKQEQLKRRLSTLMMFSRLKRRKKETTHLYDVIISTTYTVDRWTSNSSFPPNSASGAVEDVCFMIVGHLEVTWDCNAGAADGLDALGELRNPVFTKDNWRGKKKKKKIFIVFKTHIYTGEGYGTGTYHLPPSHSYNLIFIVYFIQPE